MWNRKDAVEHLNQHAGRYSQGRCAEYVRKAVEAGGLKLLRRMSAKDYGESLELAGFYRVFAVPTVFFEADIAIVAPLVDHPHGHIAMFNGAIWISDFKQLRGIYPGPAYREHRPAIAIYRY
ncbi:hypothetical protein [Nevskia sp.]|uniref:hypothetical protein n=1 Tax=Nevskia sp. TaxID=1929292 RepID=UPI0025FE9083|nr:hypothetical protein [Nevskia sp.]